MSGLLNVNRGQAKCCLSLLIAHPPNDIFIPAKTKSSETDISCLGLYVDFAFVIRITKFFSPTRCRAMLTLAITISDRRASSTHGNSSNRNQTQTPDLTALWVRGLLARETGWGGGGVKPQLTPGREKLLGQPKQLSAHSCSQTGASCSGFMFVLDGTSDADRHRGCSGPPHRLPGLAHGESTPASLWTETAEGTHTNELIRDFIY